MSQRTESPKLEPPGPDAPRGLMQKALDAAERVGNRGPHPVVMLLILIAIVVVISALATLEG